jgi:hypothetical protein
MADFCAQCAIEYEFPMTDFTIGRLCVPGYGYSEICEGCGVILVDGFGFCLGCDYRRHNQPCRPDLEHFQACFKLDGDFFCHCGCSGDEVYCMAEFEKVSR